MEQWEAKIRDKEIQGEAMNELSGHGKVDEQFKDMDKDAALDDELAALKAKASATATQALPAGTPKLIVASDPPSPKTIVDENVPMVIDVEVSGPGDEKGK
jgi:hypothetical protein